MVGWKVYYLARGKGEQRCESTRKGGRGRANKQGNTPEREAYIYGCIDKWNFDQPVDG